MFHRFMILLSTGRLKGSTRYRCSTAWATQWKASIDRTAYRHNTGMLKMPQYRTFACRRIFSPLRMTLFNPECHHIIRLWDSAPVSPVNQSSMWPFEFSWPLHWLVLEKFAASLAAGHSTGLTNNNGNNFVLINVQKIYSFPSCSFGYSQPLPAAKDSSCCVGVCFG